MKTIYLNGEELQIASETMGFREMIDQLSDDISKDSRVISKVSIDGVEINEIDQAAIATNPISSLGKVEIHSTSAADMAYETLNTLEIYVDRLMQTIERSATLYKNKNYLAADSYFLKGIDGLDLLVQTITGVKMALRFTSQNKVALLEATLASVMSDLLTAKKENNYVLLADLLENDLMENLKEWKEVGFPAFRAWKNA